MKTTVYSLVDICKIRSGKRLPQGTDFSTEQTPYKYIRARDIKAGSIDGVNLGCISAEVQNKISKYIVSTHDIVLTIAGTIGNVAYVTCEFDGMNLTENAVRLTEFASFVNSKYLMYILSSLEYWELMQQIAGGAAQPKLGIYKVEAIEVKLPSKEQQDKIVAILSAYDDLIENNQKQIQLLEEAAQRLYKEWFVDLRFPGHETTLITNGIPEGWKISEVSDFGEIVTGKTPSTSKEEYYGGNIPFVKIPDMHDRVFPVTTEVSLTKEGADAQKNKYIPRNSLMVSCIATVGLVNIALEECQTNQQINSVILHNERDLYFMYFTLKQMKSLLDGVGSNGATMTNVNKTKFGKIPVVCPSADLRNAFYEWCEPVFRKIENLSRNIVLLQEARDSLLPKLMNGEIEV